MSKPETWFTGSPYKKSKKGMIDLLILNRPNSRSAFKYIMGLLFMLAHLQCAAQITILEGWFAVVQEKPRYFTDNDSNPVWGSVLVHLGNNSSLRVDCSNGDLALMDVKIDNVVKLYWDLRLTNMEYRVVNNIDSLFNTFLKHYSGPTDSIIKYKNKEDYRLMKYPTIFKVKKRGYHDYGRRIHYFIGRLETVFAGQNRIKFFPEGEIDINEYVYFGGNTNDSLTYKFSIVHPQNGRELFMDVGY